MSSLAGASELCSLSSEIGRQDGSRNRIRNRSWGQQTFLVLARLYASGGRWNQSSPGAESALVSWLTWLALWFYQIGQVETGAFVLIGPVYSSNYLGVFHWILIWFVWITWELWKAVKRLDSIRSMEVNQSWYWSNITVRMVKRAFLERILNESFQCWGSHQHWKLDPFGSNVAWPERCCLLGRGEKERGKWKFGQHLLLQKTRYPTSPFFTFCSSFPIRYAPKEAHRLNLTLVRPIFLLWNGFFCFNRQTAVL